MPQDTKLGNLAVELGGKEKEEIMQDPVLLKRDYSLTYVGSIFILGPFLYQH